jgi:GNAT superfamily N-acetyltransferase
MGRLVGDGAMYCFVVDVVGDPHHQGRGLGRAITERLEAIATARAFGQRLDLVAAPPVVPFYQHLGYSRLESNLMRKALSY